MENTIRRSDASRLKSMAFNPNIPAPGDLLSNSQGQLLANNGVLDNIFSINHYTFSDTSGNAGKHKFVEMPINPLPTISINEGAVYVKSSGQSQMFYTSDTGAKEYQLTRAIDANAASFGIVTALPTPAQGSGAWTFLPGGLIMKYGNFLLVPSSLTTYTLNGPAFTSAPTSILLTVSSSSSTDNAAIWNNATTTTVDVRVFSGFRTVSYVIMGK